jgi:hypothetical protein
MYKINEFDGIVEVVSGEKTVALKAELKTGKARLKT